VLSAAASNQSAWCPACDAPPAQSSSAQHGGDLVRCCCCLLLLLPPLCAYCPGAAERGGADLRWFCDRLPALGANVGGEEWKAAFGDQEFAEAAYADPLMVLSTPKLGPMTSVLSMTSDTYARLEECSAPFLVRVPPPTSLLLGLPWVLWWEASPSADWQRAQAAPPAVSVANTGHRVALCSLPASAAGKKRAGCLGPAGCSLCGQCTTLL
jgi:hypothetical protein